MPAKRMKLRMIKDVLRLKYEAHLSHQTIAQALGISKGVVAKYAALAEAAGLADWALLRELDETALEARLLPRRTGSHNVTAPDFGRVHQELGRKGVTLHLLWEEYVAAHPGQRTWGRTQFCEHYRRFAVTGNPAASFLRLLPPRRIPPVTNQRGGDGHGRTTGTQVDSTR